MNTFGFVNVLFFACGVILLGIAFAYIMRIRNGPRPKEKWNLHEKTTGAVVSVRQDISHRGGDKHLTYVPTIRFMACGREYVCNKMVTSFRYSTWEYAKPDDKVCVWYDPENPERYFAAPPETAYKKDRSGTIFLRYIIPFYIVAASVMVKNRMQTSADEVARG